MTRAHRLGLAIALVAGLVFVSVAHANCWLMMGLGSGGCDGSGGGSPAASLDFSSADNSQYIPLLGGFP